MQIKDFTVSSLLRGHFFKLLFSLGGNDLQTTSFANHYYSKFLPPKMLKAAGGEKMG